MTFACASWLPSNTEQQQGLLGSVRGCNRAIRSRAPPLRQRGAHRQLHVLRQMHAVNVRRRVERNKTGEAAACCGEPWMGGAGSGVECLDLNDGATCPALAIFCSKRTGHTAFWGSTRHVSVHRRRGSGRRRRCARTFPGQPMRHRCRATTRPLIDRRRLASRSNAERSATGGVSIGGTTRSAHSNDSRTRSAVAMSSCRRASAGVTHAPSSCMALRGMPFVARCAARSDAPSQRRPNSSGSPIA